jgi:DNA-binding GntR family transcriptional regulator
MSNAVAERLKSDILDNALAPASRLRLFDLTDKYETTAGKMREALIQLASEGLIAYEPKRGFALLPLSTAELRDVTKLRIELESVAFREAIHLGGDEWESAIVGSLHLLAKAEKGSIKNRSRLDSDWSVKHRAFHAALLSACESPWRLRFSKQLSDHAERYRRLSIAVRKHERDIHAEHQAIADAAIARKADAACSLLAKHYTATADAVSAALAAARKGE